MQSRCLKLIRATAFNYIENMVKHKLEPFYYVPEHKNPIYPFQTKIQIILFGKNIINIMMSRMHGSYANIQNTP